VFAAVVEKVVKFEELKEINLGWLQMILQLQLVEVQDLFL
jgi:hypothetical protein